MANDNQFHFNQLKQNILKMKTELPILLGNQAQNYFVASFTQQGWDGAHWKEVKRRIPGTKSYKYPKTKELSRRTSPILVRTAALRRAVSNSIRSATWERVRLVVDLPYAERQNKDRKYMGDSLILRQKQMKLITNYTNKLWQH